MTIKIRQKAEGRRQRAEGRGQKAEGRRIDCRGIPTHHGRSRDSEETSELKLITLFLGSIRELVFS
jgi:hypothetical protein